MKTHEGKMWDCSYCGKKFTTKYFLKKHRRLHTGKILISLSRNNLIILTTKVKRHIPATYVARHLPFNSPFTSTCSTTLMRSRTTAHGRTVEKPSRSCQLCRITSESTAGRGRLFARLATRAFVRGFHILSTEGELSKHNQSFRNQRQLLPWSRFTWNVIQDSHWSAALHLHCLWQEIQIQGQKSNSTFFLTCTVAKYLPLCEL